MSHHDPSQNEVYEPGAPERTTKDDPIVHGRQWREERDRYRSALEKIVALNMPYRDLANRSRDLARKALADPERP